VTLASLIRKRSTGSLATAIAAIPATPLKADPPSVAGIAPVAVAIPEGRHSAPPAANDDAGLAPSTANQWRVFERDGSVREVTYSPVATAAQVWRDYPGCRAVIEVASTVAACALCKHATKYRNCGEPVRAGLTDRFEIVKHPAGGAGCAAYMPQTMGDTHEGN
jgi:hypothetical protein